MPPECPSIPPCSQVKMPETMKPSSIDDIAPPPSQGKMLEATEAFSVDNIDSSLISDQAESSCTAIIPRTTGMPSQELVKTSSASYPLRVQKAQSAPTPEKSKITTTKPFLQSTALLLMLISKFSYMLADYVDGPSAPGNNQSMPSTDEPNATSMEVTARPSKSRKRSPSAWKMSSADLTNYALCIAHIVRNGAATSLLHCIFVCLGALNVIDKLPLGPLEPVLRCAILEFFEFQLCEEVLGTAFAMLCAAGTIPNMAVAPFFLMSILPGK